MSNTRVSVRLIYQQLMMTVKNPIHFSGGSMSIEQDNRHEITEELCKKLLDTDKYICTFGASNLKIFWINIGDKFIIEEYDGWEDIKTVDNLTLTA